MPTSRAVLLLGMHRSGTSAIARGLCALGVYLGSDFLDAQPENPTGYWEDKGVVEIDERVLRELGLKWDSLALVDRRNFDRRAMRALGRKATRYCRQAFTRQPLWGFKDPRTIRILPFWRDVLHASAASESYVLAIRNPRSVAASLLARQAMEAGDAYRLWLVHMVPFLRDITDKPLVVVDYDLLMRDPRAQLERIGRVLEITGASTEPDVDRFVAEFLDTDLRHSVFELDDLDAVDETARLTRDAYALLRDLAGDRLCAGSAFWGAWEGVEARLAQLLPAPQKRSLRFDPRTWWRPARPSRNA
jgi:hypothetical protein